MLPVIDGFGVCRVLRRDDDLPVLMLTARAAEDDVLLGLELGADDYMTKPYSPRELMARIRTVLRRSGRAGADRRDERVVRAAGPRRRPGAARGAVRRRTRGLHARPSSRSCWRWPPNPNGSSPRRQLLQCTHGFDRSSTERAVDVHIMNLRRKIEADPRRPVRLLTVFGVGYKLSGGRA